MPEQKSKQKEAEKEEPKQAKKSDKLAAVLIRSKTNLAPQVKDTLEMLKLERKHACVVVDDTPSFRGMLKRVDGAVTWGEVKAGTIKKLKSERGTKGHFNLHPPRGGFERKGIKMPYKRGGALGYRGEDINELLEKML